MKLTVGFLPDFAILRFSLERAEVLHDMIPGSLLHVIPDAGHLVIEEQPDQLIKKIRPFLQNEDIT